MTMQYVECNGWTNKTTWLLSVHDFIPYMAQYCSPAVSDMCNCENMEQAFDAWLIDTLTMYGCTKIEGLVKDLLTDVSTHIDWAEILEHIKIDEWSN